MVARIPNTWPSGIWDFSKPAAYLGGDGGGGLGSGLGMTVGAAIGIRDSGRPVVAFLGDGDTLFAPSALWTAAHYRVPALFVVANNQSYFNDEEHQDWIARVRRRPVENRWLGQRMDDPPVDFAALARSLGVEAFGPVLSPGDLAGVYAEAVRTLQRGEPVLVDVRIDPR
jgi:thiamine pyrophosphate-dependent acetolactate synthase large subunit-like protein